MSDPRATYQDRHARRRAELEFLNRRSSLIGYLRLSVFVLALAVGWLSFGRSLISAWALLLPLILFALLMGWHSRTDRKQTLARRAIRFYDRGLLRLDDAWAGTGADGLAFQEPDHIYAADLDVFGKGSLFELLSIARTATGEQTLARWLKAPAPHDQVRLRQAATSEMTSRLDLREDVALLGDDVRAEVHPDTLIAWSKAPEVSFPGWAPAGAFILAILAVASIAGFFAVKAVPPSAVLLTLALNGIFIAYLRVGVARVLAATETPAGELRILHQLIGRLEGEAFDSPMLASLQATFRLTGHPASQRIARLERLAEWLDSSDHVLMRILSPILLIRQQLAFALEKWRRENGAHVGAWLAAAGEFEALSSFGCLAYERPQWTFPKLLAEAPPHISAAALTHPLIPASRAVANDVAIGPTPDRPDAAQLWIISGSNMSGKSTLLRAIGLNTVLASAGAPVAARDFRLSPLQPGGSIRTVDSLQEGRSRFYAEITRIRQIMDRSESSSGGGPPVLFLLDELLSGTNSHDRRIGAAAIVRGLLERGSIGCLTTHDLALASLADDLSAFEQRPQNGVGARRNFRASAANVHFDDKIIDGRIEFDYHLQPGVVTRSNALALMRAVGLDVS